VRRRRQCCLRLSRARRPGGGWQAGQARLPRSSRRSLRGLPRRCGRGQRAARLLWLGGSTRCRAQGSAGGRAILTIFARGTNYCRTVRREHVHQRVKLRVSLPDGAAFFACFDAKCAALRRQPGAQRPTPPAYEALPPRKTLREFERAHSR